jgi:hypothetical protein
MNELWVNINYANESYLFITHLVCVTTTLANKYNSNELISSVFSLTIGFCFEK